MILSTLTIIFGYICNHLLQVERQNPHSAVSPALPALIQARPDTARTRDDDAAGWTIQIVQILDLPAHRDTSHSILRFARRELVTATGDLTPTRHGGHCGS
jgi:hypothetical protein